jgi:predicted XRE-type DNA-binding protein
MKKPNAENEPEVTRMTGNVFAQLGRTNADDLLRRSRVMNVINKAIVERALTQEAAAKAMGIDQADVSRLSNGRVSRFSLDRLLTMVHKLGIEIDLVQRRDDKGNLVVTVHERVHA